MTCLINDKGSEGLKIIKLYIEDYKKFKNLTLNFKEEFYDNQELIEYFYPEIDIKAFVGLNGSGKTTIMSFICIIFRNLERYQDSIPCNFKIKYLIKNHAVTIRKSDNNIFFKLDDISEKLLLEYNVSKKKYARKKGQEHLAFEDTNLIEICNYLPKSCIVIAADVDYPNNYSANLIRNLDIYQSINDNFFQDTSIIGKNVSFGVYRYLDRSIKDNFKTMNSLNISFSGYIKIFFNFDKNTNDNALKKLEIKLGKQKLLNHKFIVQQIKDLSYFEKYINENENSDLNNKVLGECFNINEYFKAEKINRFILKTLIQHNLVYINDIYFSSNNALYGFENMSTGEKNFLGSLLFVLNHIKKDSIVIIEEPENHLNDNWTSKLMDVYSLYFSGYNSQFLITSHSYSFVNKLFKEQILLCGENISEPSFNTFLSSADNILLKLENDMYQVDKLENKIQTLINVYDKQTLKLLFDNLGESFYRYELFLYLKGKGFFDVESDE